MPHRVTAERVAGEQNDVDGEDDGAKSDAELFATTVVEPERLPHVVREEKQKQHRNVHEVAVDVLQNQWKRSLADVALSRLTHGAVRRIRPKRLVVGAAIVVAGESKQAGKRQNDQRRRERKQRRPPSWLRAKPGRLRVAVNLRRIKWRQVWSVRVMSV